MNKNYNFLLTVIVIISIVGFIFLNSSKSGEESNKISQSLANKVANSDLGSVEVTNNGEDFKDIEENIKIDDNSDSQNYLQKVNLIVRKSAHMIEFCILAIVLMYLFYKMNFDMKNRIIYSLFIVLFIATMDEFYQQYVPGRSSLVSDVVIDFIGGIIGASIMGIGQFYKEIIIKKYKVERIGKGEKENFN